MLKSIFTEISLYFEFIGLKKIKKELIYFHSVQYMNRMHYVYSIHIYTVYISHAIFYDKNKYSFLNWGQYRNYPSRWLINKS